MHCPILAFLLPPGRLGLLGCGTLPQYRDPHTICDSVADRKSHIAFSSSRIFHFTDLVWCRSRGGRQWTREGDVKRGTCSPRDLLLLPASPLLAWLIEMPSLQWFLDVRWHNDDFEKTWRVGIISPKDPYPLGSVSGSGTTVAVTSRTPLDRDDASRVQVLPALTSHCRSFVSSTKIRFAKGY